MKKALMVAAGITSIMGCLHAGGDIKVEEKVAVKAPPAYKPKPVTADDGSIHGYLRLHHIFDGEENGYDKETGSTLGIALGYGFQLSEGIKVGAEFYGVTDTGLTDTDTPYIAYGQFMNEVKSPDELDFGYTWGIHLKYQHDLFKLALARSQFISPLTKTQISQVPNMYEYARVDGDLYDGKASLAYISKMAYGSRSAADFGLIGEFTGTAGMFYTPFTNPSSPYLTRGKYYDIDRTVPNSDSSGIFVAGYEKKIDKLNVKVWDFMIDDIANNFYIESDHAWSLGKGKGFKLSGQFLHQNINNDFYEAKYGGTMWGLEAALKWGKVVAKAAFNGKDDGGILNAWGSNPAYTSSIFSRNAYRSNVDAYKATLVYQPMKNLKFVASYADYGKSDMVSSKYGSPVSDAKETDLVVVYKLRPDLSLKLFNANRTSEYDSSTVERTQNHTRLIVNYAF